MTKKDWEQTQAFVEGMTKARTQANRTIKDFVRESLMERDGSASAINPLLDALRPFAEVAQQIDSGRLILTMKDDLHGWLPEFSAALAEYRRWRSDL